ncbi:MAG TPA: peptidoglycan DD-metalloendopeptidase family protein [Anaerolineaceae bacterium]
MNNVKLVIAAAVMALGLAALAVIQAAGAPLPLDSAAPLLAPRLTPTPTARPQPVTPQQAAQDRAVLEAELQKAVKAKPQILAFLVREVFVDRIEYTPDGATALVWLALRDPKTKQVIATENGLAIGKRLNPGAKTNPQWKITLQADSDYSVLLDQVPTTLLNEQERKRYLPPPAGAGALAASTFSGYKLPWAKGSGKWLTQSVDHVNTTCSVCLYAFDFADNTMFPLLAAKGGTVKYWRADVANNDHSATNYLVLEDQSTSPTTYQVYYHLAYNSIPPELRVTGAPVVQGQYIGNADNTGYSTGHHLHFHVNTNPDYFFYNIVDITFDDVSVNGGRPRQCWEAQSYPQYGTQCVTNDYYISGNEIAFAPTGDISAPAWGQEILSSQVTVSGTASGKYEIAKIQIIANYGGAWREVGSPMTASPFSQTLDLCTLGVPDGPFELALRIFDKAGNPASGYPGRRQLIKNFGCPAPPPACNPSANQVAIFAGTDYTGACKLFSEGDYSLSALDPVGGNNVESVMVGANVAAVLFEQDAYSGRTETLVANDANLADNRVRANQLYSLRVLSRTTVPNAPLFNPPRIRLDAAPTTNDSLVLSWEKGDGATEFRAELIGPNNYSKIMDWTNAMSFSVGSLPAAGTYSWKVIGRNTAGQTQTNLNFTVDSATLPAASTLNAPLTENFEASAGGWTGTGLWRRAQVSVGGRTTYAWVFNNGTDYSDTNIRAGDLTSPPIAIPTSGLTLRFAYYPNTETANPQFDQRRVQISVDGGAFQDVYQFSDDPLDQVWLTSPFIDLSPYAGKTIRIRFHFNTIDRFYNRNLKGWFVDDITISSQQPPSGCSDADNTPGQATIIQFGDTLPGVICPPGDQDFYVFVGQAGQKVVVDIDAKIMLSVLDPVVTLYDADGKSVLAENDDEVYGEWQDSILGYTLPRTGMYYIKVRAYDHPSIGAAGAYYTLKLINDLQPPVLTMIYPYSNYVSNNPFVIKASASDPDGGSIARVDFYWHSSDWNTGSWQLLGTDTTIQDGWQFAFDPAVYGAVSGSALYVQAVDYAGRSRGVMTWNLTPDTLAPSITLNPVKSGLQTTAIPLSWTASDGQSAISHVDIEYREGSGEWQTWGSVNAPATLAYILGNPGKAYTFRAKAVDLAGNASAYSNEVSASTPSTCAYDLFEFDDNTAAKAVLVPYREKLEHNLCKDDVDWVSFPALRGDKLLIRSLPIDGFAALKVSLYDTDAAALLVEKSAPGLNQATEIYWTAPKDGVYYVRYTAIDPRLFGTAVRYYSWIGPAHFMMMPVLAK